jgi:hypothetical protein
MGPRAVMDNLEEKKVAFPYRESYPGSSNPYPKSQYRLRYPGSPFTMYNINMHQSFLFTN